MVGIGRCLIELDDNVHSGAVIAAFESVKVFRQLALAVGKGQSGSQQGDQRQEGKPRAPSRCLKDARVRGSPCSACGKQQRASSTALKRRGGQGPMTSVLSVLTVCVP